MSVFKSYLRQLLRRLKELQEAEKNGDTVVVKQIIAELVEDAQKGLED